MNKQLKIFALALVSLFVVETGTQLLHAQSGVLIGKRDGSTNKFAKLEVYSTQSGLLIPRMSTAERIAINPDETAVGLLVFDLSEKAFFYFEGTKWIKLSTTGNTVQMPVDTVDVSGNFQAILLKIKGDSTFFENKINKLFNKVISDSTYFSKLYGAQNNQKAIDSLKAEISRIYIKISNDSLLFTNRLVTIERKFTRKIVEDSVYFENRINSIKPASAPSAHGVCILNHISQLKATGAKVGDMCFVKDNGKGQNEWFVYTDTNGDSYGDSWISLSISSTATSKDFTVFIGESNSLEKSGKISVDELLSTGNFMAYSNQKDFDENGYNLIKGNKKFYVVAFPAEWGRPQFYLDDYEVVDGLKKQNLAINGIDYQVWRIATLVPDWYKNVKLTIIK